MSRVIAYSFASKRMKRSHMEMEENADSTLSKKIVDINIDCLESVFEFLEFRDLINVAEASKHLKVGAEIVFARKLKKRMIVVELEWGSYHTINTYDDAISIRVSQLAAKAIRLFGQRITGIYLNIEENDFLRKQFFVHVNKHCHKTLNTLYILGENSNILSSVENPFENVEKFSSKKTTVGPEWEHFNRLFPRLRQLILTDYDIRDTKYICQTFPNLDTLHLFYSYCYGKENCITESELERIINLNPQLQSFALVDYNNPRIWEFINTKLKNLKSIDGCYLSELVDDFKGTPVQINNVETFKVWSDFNSSTTKPIDVFSFKRLKKITVNCRHDQLEIWLDFVLTHPTIEELVINFIDVMSWPSYLKHFENLHEKLNKVSENTKFISLRMSKSIFQGIDTDKELPKFLKAYQHFTKFFVRFFYHDLPEAVSEMKLFSEKIPQIKNYKMIKETMTYEALGYENGRCQTGNINFEKREQESIRRIEQS